MAKKIKVKVTNYTWAFYFSEKNISSNFLFYFINNTIKYFKTDDKQLSVRVMILRRHASIFSKIFMVERIEKQVYDMSRDIRFPTVWYVRPAKAQTSLCISEVWSEHLLVAWTF